MVRKTTATEVKKTAKKTKNPSKTKTVSPKDASMFDEVKNKWDAGIESVKGKIGEGEELFSDEITSAKEVTKSFVMKAMTWIEENRQTIAGIILLVLAMRELWNIIFGIVLLIAGILLVTGYFTPRK